jgi:hypothetical protein
MVPLIFKILSVFKQLQFTWAIVSFLEQPIHFPQRITSFQLIISVWLFGGYFVGNFYKGGMYSNLAFNTIPPVTSTLNELLSDNELYYIPIHTTSSMVAVVSLNPDGPDGQRLVQMVVSILKESAIPKVLLSLDKNSSYYGTIQLLKNISIFLNITQYEFSANASLERPIKQNNNSNKTFVVPNLFSIVDMEPDVFNLENLLKVFDIYKSVRSTEINLFTTRRTWISKKNQFGVLLSRDIMLLEESGIYSNWRKNLLDHSLLEQIKEFNNETDKSSLPFAVYFQRIILAKHLTTTSFSDADSISLRVLKVPMVFCFGLILMKFVVFILEVLVKLIKDYNNVKIYDVN